EKIPASEITPEAVYRTRRLFMRGLFNASVLGMGAAISGKALAEPGYIAAEAENKGPDWLKQQIAAAQAESSPLMESLTPYRDITQYNNFYEFGMQKNDPAKHGDKLQTNPWTVEIAGA